MSTPNKHYISKSMTQFYLAYVIILFTFIVIDRYAMIQAVFLDNFALYIRTRGLSNILGVLYRLIFVLFLYGIYEELKPKIKHKLFRPLFISLLVIHIVQSVIWITGLLLANYPHNPYIVILSSIIQTISNGLSMILVIILVIGLFTVFRKLFPKLTLLGFIYITLYIRLFFTMIFINAYFQPESYFIITSITQGLSLIGSLLLFIIIKKINKPYLPNEINEKA
ncbi:hypothetical protein [Liberiplasma polymorphum]|uniref:hypothetical protein n=1 Tax=Liberiplasma polymorphum TaxID=3374570 RepID=UPI0037752396